MPIYPLASIGSLESSGGVGLATIYGDGAGAPTPPLGYADGVRYSSNRYGASRYGVMRYGTVPA